MKSGCLIEDFIFISSLSGHEDIYFEAFKGICERLYMGHGMYYPSKIRINKACQLTCRGQKKKKNSLPILSGSQFSLKMNLEKFFLQTLIMTLLFFHVFNFTKMIFQRKAFLEIAFPLIPRIGMMALTGIGFQPMAQLFGMDKEKVHRTSVHLCLALGRKSVSSSKTNMLKILPADDWLDSRPAAWQTRHTVLKAQPFCLPHGEYVSNQSLKKSFQCFDFHNRQMYLS